jgi:purine-binding chemotaxis protein CheW
LQPNPQRFLVVFQLAGQHVALPLESVQRIVPMAQLGRPPGLPSALEGILNLGGTAVPVVRLDRLLQLPAHSPGLYSMLIVLKGDADGRIAVLVDRVNEILSLPESALLPVAGTGSFNSCAEAAASVRGENIHVLSPARILLEKEREALSEFQAMTQRRLQDWEPGKP